MVSYLIRIARILTVSISKNQLNIASAQWAENEPFSARDKILTYMKVINIIHNLLWHNMISKRFVSDIMSFFVIGAKTHQTSGAFSQQGLISESKRDTTKIIFIMHIYLCGALVSRRALKNSNFKFRGH